MTDSQQQGPGGRLGTSGTARAVQASGCLILDLPTQCSQTSHTCVGTQTCNGTYAKQTACATSTVQYTGACWGPYIFQLLGHYLLQISFSSPAHMFFLRLHPSPLCQYCACTDCLALCSHLFYDRVCCADRVLTLSLSEMSIVNPPNGSCL